MMRRNISKIGHFLASSLAAASVLGCSNLGKPYSQINPEDAERRLKAANGYHELKSLSEGQAKVVLRSERAPDPVNFSICKSAAQCDDFEKIGMVQNGGEGVLLPWISDIANINKTQYLTLKLSPGQKVSIRGNGGSALPFSKDRRCGPLTSTFVPLVNHNYLVRFLWGGRECIQEVLDATDPDNMKPVHASPGVSSQ